MQDKKPKISMIKKFSDGSELSFEEGRFDFWCVYYKEKNQHKKAPKDIEYFSRLIEIASLYDSKRIYNDFVSIYNITESNLNVKVLELIEQISKSYEKNILEIEKILTIIYAGMIAEENKKNAKLKKRIKRLGIYQILIENINADEAANFSKGKKWKELDKLCKERGF